MFTQPGLTADILYMVNKRRYWTTVFWNDYPVQLWIQRKDNLLMILRVVFSLNRANRSSVSFPGKKCKVQEETRTWKTHLPVGRMNVGGRIWHFTKGASTSRCSWGEITLAPATRNHPLVKPGSAVWIVSLWVWEYLHQVLVTFLKGSWKARLSSAVEIYG